MDLQLGRARRVIYLVVSLLNPAGRGYYMSI
jgi:hypothetical protein